MFIVPGEETLYVGSEAAGSRQHGTCSTRWCGQHSATRERLRQHTRSKPEAPSRHGYYQRAFLKEAAGHTTGSCPALPNDDIITTLPPPPPLLQSTAASTAATHHTMKHITRKHMARSRQCVGAWLLLTCVAQAWACCCSFCRAVPLGRHAGPCAAGLLTGAVPQGPSC
jgi:hypothetical protein